MAKSQNSMRAQVAQSKGTEWMVSSYNAWQQRSPLPDMPERNESSLMRLVSRMSQNEDKPYKSMVVSFRSVLLLIVLIMSFKSR